ncbi:hypothetical protein STCU_04530 [Strigomonas culicis]|uniref:Uncharacterized protein n=1 Tax=Strigomonas culicis TaxID=28005 RepID=S9W0M6_9TRYP|nr:hypothetical protein STCU_04530 [Strigomonas culicis]|eukprot:EPY29490.1 hypothetical protein STCU_04530 [Strigomonas culicis]
MASLSQELHNATITMTARNTSTRQISRGTFLRLAQHFDPAQPCIRKRTQRFLYNTNQLTLVTFLMPAELRGVSRVVGPASLTLSELPLWMDVDEAVSLMGTDTVM